MRYLPVVVLSLFFFSGCAHLRQDTGLRTYVDGLFYEDAEKTDEAIAAYRKTIQEAGENSYIYIKLGNLYLKKHDTKEAKRCFFRAARLNPKSNEAFFGLGFTYLLEKNNKLATIYFEKSLALEPENHSVRMLLCDIYVGMNMLNESVGHYRILLDTYPDNWLLYYNCGNLFERLGDFESAERYYLRAVEISELFWKAHFSLGLLYNKLGKEEESIKHLVRVIELDSGNRLSYSFLASIYYSKGDIEKTRYYLNRAIKNEIKDPEFYNLLGVTYLEEKNYEKAKEAFRNGIEIEDNSSGRFYLGTLYEKTSDKDKMETEIKKAIELNPDNAVALNYLGYTYLLEDRDIEEAYKMIKKACEIDPDNGAFLDSLGWAYYKMGSYRRSKKYLEEAAVLEKDAEIYEHLGHLYIKLEDYTKALYWFVRSYEMSNNKDLLKIIGELKERIKNELN